MNENKMNQFTPLLIITLVFYVAGFLGSKNTYLSSKIVILSMIVSLLILLILVLKKYNVTKTSDIVYGTIGLNNAILCAILNSIEIGRNLTQQAIALGIHIVVFFAIIVVLEVCFRRQKAIQNAKTKTIASTSLVTLIVACGMFLARYLLRYGIDIRIVGCFTCGFLGCTMFYIFLICERIRKKNQSGENKSGENQSGDGSMIEP